MFRDRLASWIMAVQLMGTVPVITGSTESVIYDLRSSSWIEL